MSARKNRNNKKVRRQKNSATSNKIDNYDPMWSEVICTGEICKYHNHNPNKIKLSETDNIVGLHLWDDKTNEWLAAKSLTLESREIMIIRNSLWEVMDNVDFKEFKKTFSKVHPIISDEKYRPISLRVDGVLLPLIEENRVTIEAIRCELFQMYAFLKKNLDDDFRKGRCLVLRGIVWMIIFDPIRGDVKEVMTPKDDELWDKLHGDIMAGARFLHKAGGIDAMHDDLLWSYIPISLRRDIDILFGCVDEWVEKYKYVDV